LIDDDDAPPPLERAIHRPIDDIAHLIDLDRAAVARFDDDNVRVDATGNARTCRTAPARVERQRIVGLRPGGRRGWIGDWRLAIERLREGDRGEPLTNAGRTGEQKARGQRSTRRRPREQLDQAEVADNVPKWHKEAFGTNRITL